MIHQNITSASEQQPFAFDENIEHCVFYHQMLVNIFNTEKYYDIVVDRETVFIPFLPNM